MAFPKFDGLQYCLSNCYPLFPTYELDLQRALRPPFLANGPLILRWNQRTNSQQTSHAAKPDDHQLHSMTLAYQRLAVLLVLCMLCS